MAKINVNNPGVYKSPLSKAFTKIISAELKPIVSNYTLGPDDNGLALLLNSDIVLTIPHILPTGFKCTYYNLSGAQITIDTSLSIIGEISNKTNTIGELLIVNDDLIISAIPINLDNIDNTSDSDKPISDATQLALNDKASNDVVTTTTNGLMASTDKVKLDGIEDDANNYVHPSGDGNLHVPATGTTNNGRVLTAGATDGSLSWIALTKTSVGLGNVDNTSDIDKPISTATQNALNLKATTTDLGTASTRNTGTVSGTVPLLDSDGKLDTSILPAIAITDTFVVDNEVDMLSLDAQRGDVAIRTDIDATFILAEDTPEDINSWKELLSGGGPAGVSSVAGLTGNVSSSALKGALSIDNIDNTSDANKPISTATQNALNTKASTSVVSTLENGLMSVADKIKLNGIEDDANNYVHPSGDGNLHVPATGTTNNGRVLTAGATDGSLAWTALTKSSVGLGNVDNTSDANKPISTATQNALNLKATTTDLGTASTRNTGTTAGTVPLLDSNGKLDTAILPAIALTDTFVVDNEVDMLSLDAQRGDIAIRTDIDKTFILAEDTPEDINSWKELLSGGGGSAGVTSVAGLTGNVSSAALKGALSIDNVDNTSDANKPVSTATNNALNALATYVDNGLLLKANSADLKDGAYYDVGTTDGTLALVGAGGKLPVSLFRESTESQTGIVRIASVVEAVAGTASFRAVNPVGLIAARLRENVMTISIASYTPTTTDATTLYDVSSESSIIFNIPLNSEQAFVINTAFKVRNSGTGVLRIFGGAGVTLIASFDPFEIPPHSVVSVRKIDTNTWVLDRSNSELLGSISLGAQVLVSDNNIQIDASGSLNINANGGVISGVDFDGGTF